MYLHGIVICYPSIGKVNFKVDVQNGYSFCGNPMKKGCVYLVYLSKTFKIGLRGVHFLKPLWQSLAEYASNSVARKKIQ